MKNDIYRTLSVPADEIVFKEKGSKFYGYAFPIQSEEDVTEILAELKSAHRSARHWCYAWQLGAEDISYRANDDGEPRNSAGIPIYGQIQSFEITNVLVVVVRYFGGTKLGVGGLVKAYKTAAQMALSNASIIEKTIDAIFYLQFDYSLMNKVMRIIKENDLQIVTQESALNCKIRLGVRKSEAAKIERYFSSIYGLSFKKQF